jgi:putative peptide zinc metalloprotease protein
MATVLLQELPKLRNDLHFSRQETAEGAAYIVKDPVSGRFFRFRETELFVTKQLDGVTTLDVISRRAEERFGEPVSTDMLKLFVDRLQGLGLLESAAAAGQQPRAGPGRIRGDLFYLRLKAFDPDRLFTRLLPYVRFCFTPAFLACATALILFAFGLTLVNTAEIQQQAAHLYRVETFLLIWATILAVTTLHEFAHGLTCKRFGGEVHEVGFMLIYFQPAFYCNVSDAWLFPKKSHRLWVTFAGAYFELFIWALAAVTWRVTEPWTWLNSATLVVAATSGVRCLFNLNPLVKLDGYYLLSDYVEIPNLRARAFQYLRSLFARAIQGAGGPAAQGEHTPPLRERRIYLWYSLLAGAFTTWLLGSVAWWVGGILVQRYQGTGFLLFAGLLILVFRRPLKRALASTSVWIKAAPQKLASMKLPVRGLALLAAVLSVLFFGRMELKVSGEFKVLPIHNNDIRAEVEGIIQKVHAYEGDLVRAGDLIVSLSDRDYRAELSKTEAEIEEKRAQLKMLEVGPRQEEIELATNVVETAMARQAQARALYEELTRLHDERLSMVKTRVEKAEELLKFARKAVERFRELKVAEMVSMKEYEEAEERAAVREKELVEAQVDLKMVLADDLADARHKVMVAAKEREEANSRLRVLLAGSRSEEIEATQAEIARLEAAHRHLTEQLGLTVVRSPVNGIITTPKLDETVGQHVNKGDLIAEVHELKTVTAEIAIPEQEIADVQVGQRVVLKARPYPQDSLEGRVTAIAPIATEEYESPSGRRVLVTSQIDNTALRLKPQMTGNAKIFCGEQRIWDLLTRRLARYVRVEFWSWW